VRVLFQPFGSSVELQAGESLFEAGRRGGVPIPTACVGKATCGLCRVKVLSGEALLSPINADEKRHLGNTYFISKLRLSCQARIVGEAIAGGEVEVLLPDAARARK
jgi:2Fe-2S ferredoxin